MEAQKMQIQISDVINNLHVLNGGNNPISPTWYLLYVVIMSTIALYLIGDNRNFERRCAALASSMVYLLVCINMVFNFNVPGAEVTPAGFHFPYKIDILPEYGINLSFGIDGIALCLLLLTGFIMTICIFLLSHTEPNYKAYLFYLYLIYTFLTFSFCLTNLLFFFVFFESVLIPMFIIIGVWGTRERKIKAAYYFFFYTLFGSFFLLYGIFFVYSIVGSLEYEALLTFSFSHQQQILLFFFFFIPFAIKIPMVPFHI
jgi:NADH:ubiquinone oxidoreductase subunit 4 (subunit M)